MFNVIVNVKLEDTSLVKMCFVSMAFFFRKPHSYVYKMYIVSVISLSKVRAYFIHNEFRY